MTTKVSVEDHKSVLRTTGYSPDPLTAQQALIRTLIAGVLGAVLTTLAWFVMHSVSLPAYNTSTSLKAL